VATIVASATIALGAALPTGTAAAADPGFVITGTAIGLAPGVPIPLTVRVDSLVDYRITVTDVVILAGDASLTCPAANFVSPGFHGAVDVPKLGVATQDVPVALAPNAPLSCVGAIFPLTYSGVAVPTSDTSAPRSGQVAFTGSEVLPVALVGASVTILGLVLLLARRGRVAGRRLEAA
jgi:hypothetical protein